MHQLFGRGLRVVVFHLRGFARKVHAGVGNEVFFVEHFFNAAGAGLAGHAVNLQIDVLGGHFASPCGLRWGENKGLLGGRVKRQPENAVGAFQAAFDARIIETAVASVFSNAAARLGNRRRFFCSRASSESDGLILYRLASSCSTLFSSA